MIDWIKIEDGCEMPSVGQEVLALTEYATLYLANILEDGGWVETTDMQDIGVVTDWARVDLPDGN